MKKKEIENAIISGNVEESKRLIEEYEKIAPQDADLISLKVNYYLLTQDMDNALKFALMGVERLPLNIEMYYNLGSIYECLGQWLDAFFNYQKAISLSALLNSSFADEFSLSEKSDNMLQVFSENIDMKKDEAELTQLKRALDAVSFFSNRSYGFHENIFRNAQNIIGSYYYEDFLHRKYVGIYNDNFLSYPDNMQDLDLLYIKGEFLDAEEGSGIQISDSASDNPADEYLIPIACSKSRTEHTFVCNDEVFPIFTLFARHFEYYRIKNHTKIQSNKKCYYGKPIPLRYKPGKKKLVLNLFVDGLCQEILGGGDFEQLMPYTYEFFRKGLIFTNAYSAAEWTAPSLANYATGLYTTHHMLYHNMFDTLLPKSVPLLSEYFQADGYHTTLMGGDWRMTPIYGYLRGIDRYIYRHQNCGFTVSQAIGTALEHLETFQDVNQYLWLNIGDLHDIADGLSLPNSVLKELPLSSLTFDGQGITSVKQNFSLNKQASYKAQARNIDRWLHILYSYLEDHYRDDEIVVSLFADHGQGYFVKPEEHFLSNGRSHVAFMFRGGMADGLGLCDEPVSPIDYSCILRKLADVQIPEVPTDGQLPKILGGNSNRGYALTESIHPSDNYQASIHTKDGTFYFINPVPVTEEGRFTLADYTYWWEDNAGNRTEDDACCRKYLDILLEHIAPILIYT